MPAAYLPTNEICHVSVIIVPASVQCLFVSKEPFATQVGGGRTQAYLSSDLSTHFFHFPCNCPKGKRFLMLVICGGSRPPY
jgi:hypothetical protein